MKKTVIVVGGGAAGIFAAANLAQMDATLKLIVLEKSAKLLAKVKISGGGRCNVTHACFDPAELVRNYPRGARELLGPFHRFQPNDTIEWFSSKGIRLKTEADGRMFPVTDSSQTIIDCLMHEVTRLGVDIRLQCGLKDISTIPGKSGFQITTTSDETMDAHAVLLAVGSSNSMWEMIKNMGHRIVEPVPSLFTFNIADSRITDLPGVSVPLAEVKIVGSKMKTSGPLLITHWGLSGPAILKLSAIAARELAAQDYSFNIVINWLSSTTINQFVEELIQVRKAMSSREVRSFLTREIPSRLWSALIPSSLHHKRWADVSNEELKILAESIVNCEMKVEGKSTFKEEFVTAGGVELKEVDFRTMESKISPGLFFAGEVLNIDAVTGGFNFQAAWTTARIAAESIVSSLSHSEEL